MPKSDKKRLIFVLSALLGIIIGSVCHICFTGGGSPAPILADIIVLLILTVVLMIAALRSFMRVSLYSYSNILLAGGILFVCVLTAVFISYFIGFLNAGELSLGYLYNAVIHFPRQFSLGALLVIILLSLLVGISNIELIRREGFCLNNALSLVIAGFYVGGTILIFLISAALDKYVFTPESSRQVLMLRTVIDLFMLLMLCYLECILAGSAYLGWKAVRQKPAYDKDFIIILGCSIDKRGGLLPLLKGRVNRAIRFAWEQEIACGKPAKYVPSGGQGPNEVMSEGSAMELYLLTRGAESDEVFPEKKSTNTWENLCFSKKIIDELKPGAKVAFATTNYHILRSGILARKAGLDAEGIAGDTKWYFWPNGFVREFFGILALNVKVHIAVAAITAAVSVLIGVVGWIGQFI